MIGKYVRYFHQLTMNTKVMCLLLISVVPFSCEVTSPYFVRPLTRNNTPVDQHLSFHNLTHWTLDSGIFPTLPNVVPNSKNVQCRKDSLLFLKNLKNLTGWAYQFWDASAKSPVGTTFGHRFQTGDFDACMSIEGPVRSKYCAVDLKIIVVPRDYQQTYPAKLHPYEYALNVYHDSGKFLNSYDRSETMWGLCVPNSCEPAEIVNYINEYLRQDWVTTKNISYEATILPGRCQNDRREETYDIYDIMFVICVGAIVALSVFGTFIDSEDSNQDCSYTSNFLRCFSWTRNFGELTAADEGSGRLRILYGLRFFSILVIIICHSASTNFGTYTANPTTVESGYTKLSHTFVFHGDIVVDTFFFLSGLLATYIILSCYQRGMHPTLLIILRYLRLTPLYAMIIFFYSTYLFKMSDGPLWEAVIGPRKSSCRGNWWLNLLYLNNYFHEREMCMIQTWYLPCDMHYFIMALILLYILHKNELFGKIAYIVALIASILIAFYVIYVNKFPGVLIYNQRLLKNARGHSMFQTFYIKSHTRASPYLIGVFFGYIFFKTKKSIFEITKSRMMMGLVMGLFLSFMSILSGVQFYLPDYEYEPLYASLYGCIHRGVWALGNGLIVLSLSFGPPNLLSRFLGYKLFVPLSKLSYGMYLIHYADLLVIIGQKRFAKSVTLMSLLNDAVTTAGYSILQSFLLYMLLEAPIIRIIKELKQKQRKDVKQPHDVNDNRISAISTLQTIMCSKL